MANREKVKKGLECCILRNPDDHARCPECTYNDPPFGNCVNRLKMDALEALKEQETALTKIARWLSLNYEPQNRDMGLFFGTEEAAQRYAEKKWMEKMNDATYRAVADGLVTRLGSFHHMKEYFSDKSTILYVGDNVAFV